jgi:C4-dicarboxylate-specific signal transduction histidine kinase
LRKIQEEKLISIGAMSSAMPHEINNPLTILSGSVNLLKKQLRNKENMDFEKIDKLLGNLDNGVVRISKIITSVKSLSSDSEKLELENFTIFELLEDILILNQSAIISNKINFSFDDSNKVEVTGIRIQIEQILINYIHNSIDEIMAKENKWI